MEIPENKTFKFPYKLLIHRHLTPNKAKSHISANFTTNQIGGQFQLILSTVFCNFVSVNN